jgi:hypothetical protein
MLPSSLLLQHPLKAPLVQALFSRTLSTSLYSTVYALSHNGVSLLLLYPLLPIRLLPLPIAVVASSRLKLSSEAGRC